MPPQDMPDLAKLAAGLFGSFVSMKFVQGSVAERLFMFVGGAAMSYYSTSPLVEWIGGRGLEGVIGFLSGLLGMMLINKLYEAIQAIDAKALASEAMAWLKRKWGA